MPVAQRTREVVGGVEDAHTRPPVFRETEHRRGAPVSSWEVHREGVDIGDAGTTEAIDRLQWVTDRGDRVATPEDPGQHPALSDRGVLVFIEQDDGELLAQHRADLGALVGQPGTEPHLIAEIDEVAHATRFAKLLDEMRELDARECGAATGGSSSGRRAPDTRACTRDAHALTHTHTCTRRSRS